MTVKKLWPANSTLFIMFRPIVLKQLNSWTTIDTFICLGGSEVTHQTAVREVPCSIPGSGKDFNVAFLFCC